MATIIEIILLLFIASYLVLQTKGGVKGLLGRRRKIILDSCALIDGRVIEIVRSGFVGDELVIPQFVLNELQMLADGHDGHKRERARFGLDIAHELQDSSFAATVTIDRTQFTDVPATDDKLIALSKKLEGLLYTTDYNLAKVAAIEAVHVLNVNELAQALRPVALPGESLKIKIVQKGSSPSQGVGYLDDGTMIVVEGAARYAGHIVEVTVTRMHQTVAGKMVFGHVKEESRQSNAPANQQHSRHSSNATHAQSAVEGPQKAKLHSRLSPAAKSSTQPHTAAPAQEKPTSSYHGGGSSNSSSSSRSRNRRINV